MKKIAFIVACIVVLCFFTASLEAAQIFDNVWFKLKVKGKGYSIGGLGVVELTKTSWSSDVYLNVVWLTSQSEFYYGIFMQDTSGAWGFVSSNTLPQTFFAGNTQEILTGNWQMIFLSGGNYYPTYSTNFIKTKRDSFDVLLSATFTSLGCEVTFPESGSIFGGGCTIKGKLVDVSELPFTPPPI